jgi:hypothetical protein
MAARPAVDAEQGSPPPDRVQRRHKAVSQLRQESRAQEACRWEGTDVELRARPPGSAAGRRTCSPEEGRREGAAPHAWRNGGGKEAAGRGWLRDGEKGGGD